METTKTFDRIESIAQVVIIALFPLIIFPFFVDVVPTGKLYFLALSVLFLIALKAVKIVLTKRIEWKTTGFETPLMLLVLAYTAAVLVNAPNKVLALIEPTRGALLPILFASLYFLLPKNNKAATLAAGFFSLGLSVVFAALVYFGAFSFVPDTFGFLKVNGFTTVSSYVYLVFFAVFLGAIVLPHVTENENETKNVRLPLAQAGTVDMVLFIVALVSAVFSAYVLFKDFRPQLVPYSVSWQTFVETLKTFRTALFGVGPNNYLSIFSLAKPASFNASSLWLINPDLGSSGLLQIATETGMLGLLSVSFIFFKLYKRVKAKSLFPVFIVLVAWFALVPSSQMMWWALLFLLILASDVSKSRSFNAEELPVVYISMAAVALGLVGGIGYLGYRGYMAQSLYFQSLVAAQTNQAQSLYEKQQQSLAQNPYSEQVHLAFAQTNLVLANSISQKKDPSDTDKQNVSQLIQQAIQEARNVVILNPQKAVYWANLGETYRQVLTVAQGADVWAISSYQRAIALDPKNPQYYFNLGSVYYGLKNYDEATRFYSNAVGFKPDIPNYQYNLAWAYYQKQDFAQAANSMETALQLIPDKKSADYKTAKRDLEAFQQKVKETQPQQEPVAADNVPPETLTQPSPIPSVSPEIALPTQSAPPTTQQ